MGVSEAMSVRFSNSTRGDITAEEVAYMDTHGPALETWHRGQSGLSPGQAGHDTVEGPYPALS